MMLNILGMKDLKADRKLKNKKNVPDSKPLHVTCLQQMLSLAAAPRGSSATEMSHSGQT